MSSDVDERTHSHSKNIPVFQNRNKQLQDYLQQKYFSEFLIIGVSQEGVVTHKANPDNEPKIASETLYMYPGENKNCERRNIIKDFCFPSGICFKQLNNLQELIIDLQKDLKAQNQLSFMFCLSGMEGADG